LVKLLSGPTWPFWSAALPSEPAGAIDAELAKAEPPSCVIIARQIDKEILAGRHLTNAARARLSVRRGYPDVKDWGFWRRYLSVAATLVFK
jgi:hypothetical protein